VLTVANGEIVRFQMPEDSFAASPGGTWLNRLKKSRGATHRKNDAGQASSRKDSAFANFAFFCLKIAAHGLTALFIPVPRRV
jgi:hypothetical protein